MVGFQRLSGICENHKRQSQGKVAFARGPRALRPEHGSGEGIMLAGPLREDGLKQLW